ncbi:MAG: DUF58 domain-containing protein [Brevefilum sp.]|nr:DUF58 domain-containing protein [Brevefilum sp.]
MMVDFLPFIIFLMILAVFLRAESALTVIYMVVGTFLLGFWWNKRALRHVEVTRSYFERAYLGETVPVVLKIKNKSILPILWLEIHEGLPVDLRSGKGFKQVFSLGIREEKQIGYDLMPRKRGYYPLGPLLISSGDPLGLMQPTQKEFPSSPLTVYPQIVNLTAFGLPSRSPFGTIKHKNPVFEDPSRILGKREFQIGDSLRRIDWKSSAATGQLQVKLYEASISLELAILLDLHRDSYTLKTFYASTELAVTAAASVAAWGKTHRQSVGLITNGTDPHNNDQVPPPLKPRTGAGHFIHILEILARVQPGESRPLESLLQDSLANLSWGATLVLISGSLHEDMLIQLFNARKRGINPAIIFTGQTPEYRSLKNLAGYYKIQLHKAALPTDLKMMGVSRT